ncbi:MAG TPA: hypothetical protein VIT23_16790, partial [Terrimicrobiaceae bacterium]
MSDSPYTKLSREEIAEMEVGNTAISRTLSIALAFAFGLTILSVPIVQHFIEIRAGFENSRSWVWPRVYEIFQYPRQAWTALRNPTNGNLTSRLREASNILTRGFQSYEVALENDSFITQMALPHTQALTAEFLGLGNEQVYLGKKNWLFYQPDVAYLTGQGFLDPSFQRTRARNGEENATKGIQPDPIKAIIQIRDQLRSRNIQLLIVPIPVKPMIEPEFLSSAYNSSAPIPLQNPSYGVFLSRLEGANIDYLDVSQTLASGKQSTGQSQFLRTDTHWTPEAMERAVTLLTEKIRTLGVEVDGQDIELKRSPRTVQGLGDIAAMLKLPENSQLFEKETVTIYPVSQADGKPWSADHGAQILVLGDSFFNIFSLEGMGWGTSAGFVEQLSYSLQRPIDAILRNDAGASATRELLSQELAHGRDRLAGKQLVVWEFAVRELSEGNWTFIDLTTPHSPVGKFLVLQAGERRKVSATIKATGAMPQPGSSPYKDFLTAFHIAGIEGVATDEAIVYLHTMQNQQL